MDLASDSLDLIPANPGVHFKGTPKRGVGKVGLPGVAMRSCHKSRHSWPSNFRWLGRQHESFGFPVRLPCRPSVDQLSMCVKTGEAQRVVSLWNCSETALILDCYFFGL